MVLHGNDLCGEFYLGLAEALAARGVRTTLVTLPGFHDVPPLPRPGWPAMVEAVRRVFSGGALVGHSLGGLLALLVAAQRPAGLERLVLLEPAILPWRWLGRAVMARYRRRVVDGDRARFENWSGSFYRVHDEARFPKEAMALYLACRQARDGATIAALLDGIPTLYPLPFGEVTVPARILVGGSSGVRQRWLAGVVGRRLSAGVDVIARAGHWLVNEQDAAVAERICAFLR